MKFLKRSKDTKNRVNIKKGTEYQRSVTRALNILALPGFLWFLIFSYIPMFGIIIAFKDFNYAKGIFQSDWVGFQNFEYLFASSTAFRLIRNTIGYNFVFIILTNVVGIALALVMDGINKRGLIKIYQTAIFLPHFVSWVIVGFIAKSLFSYETGLINSVLVSLGMDKVSWYTTSGPWPFVLPIAYVWKIMGYQTLIYYGSIIGVDPNIYEAAAVDGASKMQTVVRITLPLIKPTAIILFIMSIGSIMRADFGLFYYLPNNSGPLWEISLALPRLPCSSR